MIRLYTLPPSGNSHKVRLALSLLGLAFKEISLAGGGQKTPAFLALNPLGQVPLLVYEETVVRDSGAYLAAAYRPGEWDGFSAAERAHMAQSLMFAANEIAAGPNRLRLASLFGSKIDAPAATALTDRVLGIVETALAESDWLVGDRLTIADIAVAPYLALSHEGGVDLARYSAVERWTKRITSLPGFSTIPGWPASTPLVGKQEEDLR